MQKRTDIVVDLAYGDSGKGKVTKALAKNSIDQKAKYDYCLKFNGGPNAGHTVYENGKKFVTHQVPCGVFYDIKSVIGATCVINVDSLFEEIMELENNGIRVKDNLYIAHNAHIITETHLENDIKKDAVGTTKRGIGPCYADKAYRIGKRAEKVPELNRYIIDSFDLLSKGDKILCEGSQGFYLDIDWGIYPYVTSSVCTVAGVVQNGISPRNIADVWGVAKAYETYVGARKFEPDNEVFSRLRELGGEYGATTGRPRQCNWLNIDMLIRAAKFNAVNKLVLNKCDIIKTLGVFSLIKNEKVMTFNSFDAFRSFIIDCFSDIIYADNIYFSESKEKI